MLWAIFAAMTAVAAAVLLAPLLMRRRHAASRAAYDLEIYRDQLAEIDRDMARGVIDRTEAAAARIEISRRMLAADAEIPKEPESPSVPNPSLRLTVLVIAGAAPLAALALYLSVGSPNLPSQPLAGRLAVAGSETGEAQEVARMVNNLAERLRTNPDDLEGWALYARSLSVLNRRAEALTAWRRVMALSQDSPEFAGPFGESLVEAAGGVVTQEARIAFERALTADPHDPRALFFLGLARAQAGESRAALQIWTDIAAAAAEDAPWLPMIRARIRAVASEAKIDPATITPSPEAVAEGETRRTEARGPSAADVEAFQRMPPEERARTIRSMVDNLAARLERESDDPDGWQRLGRAWNVLGEIDKAKAALTRATELAPDRVDVLIDYASLLLAGHTNGDKLPPDFVAVMRRVLALDPNHGDALWFVGLAEAEAGNRDTAIGLWDRLLSSLTPDSAEYAEIKGRLDKLKAGG